MAKEPGIIERPIERGVFQSRWLMAPFYLGLLALTDWLSEGSKSRVEEDRSKFKKK